VIKYTYLKHEYFDSPGHISEISYWVQLHLFIFHVKNSLKSYSKRKRNNKGNIRIITGTDMLDLNCTVYIITLTWWRAYRWWCCAYSDQAPGHQGTGRGPYSRCL